MRIGTRGSALALWQANHIRDCIRKSWGSECQVELVTITTEGDRVQDRALYEIGGKGLFVKAIEAELVAGTIDIAVHSMKDMPSRLPAGLVIAATPEREDPRDALVGAAGAGDTLATLPTGARVGTGSLRRTALVRRLRPDLVVVPLRGNVPTRVEKVDRGDVDAVVLACAGLRRLDLAARISEALDAARFLPAPCQGVLALQCRSDDARTLEMLAPLDHAETRRQAAAERSFLVRLDADCHVPVACHARLDDAGGMEIEGMVIDPSSRPCFVARCSGPVSQAETLGVEVAERVLALGAAKVLDGTR